MRLNIEKFKNQRPEPAIWWFCLANSAISEFPESNSLLVIGTRSNGTLKICTISQWTWPVIFALSNIPLPENASEMTMISKSLSEWGCPETYDPNTIRRSILMFRDSKACLRRFTIRRIFPLSKAEAPQYQQEFFE